MHKILVTNEEFKRSEAYFESKEFKNLVKGYGECTVSPDRYGPIADWVDDTTGQVGKYIDNWQVIYGKQADERSHKEWLEFKARRKPLRCESVKTSIQKAIEHINYINNLPVPKVTLWQRFKKFWKTIQLFGNHKKDRKAGY